MEGAYSAFCYPFLMTSALRILFCAFATAFGLAVLANDPEASVYRDCLNRYSAEECRRISIKP